MPSFSDTLHVTTSAAAANPISKSHFLSKPTTATASSSLSLSKTLPSPPKITKLPFPAKPPKIPKPPQPPISDFEEKILFLDSLGIDLFALVSAHPPLVSSTAADVKSLVSFLRSAASLSTAEIRRIAAMCPEILSLKTSDVVPVLTFLLHEAGVSGNSLRHVIHRRPRLLASEVHTRLRPTLHFLQDVIGISEISKHTYLLSCSVEKKFIPRIKYFNSMGFSKNETKTIFRRFPPLFCYSIEENFKPKFDYFMVEMERGLNEIVEFPQYFSFSLENRIKPRHLKCVEKGVLFPLSIMLKSTEQRFLDRLEVCCGSSMPVRTSPFWNIKLDYDGVL